jgi:hypothetical protein
MREKEAGDLINDIDGYSTGHGLDPREEYLFWLVSGLVHRASLSIPHSY